MAANKVVVLALMAVVLTAALVGTTEALTCSPVQLAACAPAIMSSQPPSAACCAKLTEQKPCLCQYLKNPSLKQYISSPGAKRVASTCKVAVKC